MISAGLATAPLVTKGIRPYVEHDRASLRELLSTAINESSDNFALETLRASTTDAPSLAVKGNSVSTKTREADYIFNLN